MPNPYRKKKALTLGLFSCCFPCVAEIADCGIPTEQKNMIVYFHWVLFYAVTFYSIGCLQSAGNISDSISDANVRNGFSSKELGNRVRISVTQEMLRDELLLLCIERKI